MYVTRRLLRSTMPESEKKDVPFLPPPTPKRRAAVRASAKIGEVVADSSAPTTRSRAPKTSPKQENEGDEKNKSRNHKKAKKEKETKKKQDEPTVDASTLHGYQLMVDVHYRGEQYTEARILDLDPEKELLFVHYMGWNARFDAWVELEDVAAHGSHCEESTNKYVSWDGCTSLFATEEELAGKTKPKKTLKRKNTPSPKAQQPRKALQSCSNRKKYCEEVEEQAPAKRLQKSPKHPKSAKKSPRSTKNASSPGRRTPRRVQVAVGTTDEDSERKNDSETADLVLDVEFEGHDALSDEDVEEEQEEETPRRNNKPDKSPHGSKRKPDMDVDVAQKKPKNTASANAVAKTAPLPPRREGLGNATREKLAAIFRLRVQQRQQMEQLNASQASFQQTLQDSVETSPTSSSIADTEDSEVGKTTVANAELAAAEEYQRQLQQYYYHQQVMFAICYDDNWKRRSECDPTARWDNGSSDHSGASDCVGGASTTTSACPGVLSPVDAHTRAKCTCVGSQSGVHGDECCRMGTAVEGDAERRRQLVRHELERCDRHRRKDHSFRLRRGRERRELEGECDQLSSRHRIPGLCRESGELWCVCWDVASQERLRQERAN